MPAADPEEAIGTHDLMTEDQRALLPDPTYGLELVQIPWCHPRLFSANAEKHPEKLCVVETQSSSSPHRELTYREINEASNILGHHLVQSGIEGARWLWSMLTAVLTWWLQLSGILKAGATFSVIDPAYPPERTTSTLTLPALALW